jgi:hypothetical protein
MEEQANNVGGGPVRVPQSNAGQFRPGDPRINRGGRPKKSWATCADRAPCADRLMLLLVPAPTLVHRLSHQNAAWLANCPPDCKIVASRLDASRDAVVFVIRSETFPLIPKGAPLAEFKPQFNGLRWGRW